MPYEVVDDMVDRLMLYNIIYALAARDGRDKVLFGSSALASQAAVARSLAGDALPEFWFELPLLGDPWFDIHVLTARETLEPNMTFDPAVTAGHPDIFSWFASADAHDVRQLALSYDSGRGDVDHPAVQLLVNNTAVTPEFLAHAGGAEAADAYRAFERRLPKGWFPCYTGVFPGREPQVVHVECIPSQGQQDAYAQDPALLEAHLRQAGLDNLGETLIERSCLLARTPFRIEFQFEVLPGGVTGETFSASLRFDCPPGSDDWACFDPDGAAGELMRQVEAWGLADDRWKYLSETAFAKSAMQNGNKATFYCFPAFLKLKWRAGEPVDAKAYLMAGF